METYLRYDGSRWIANEKVNYFFAEAQGDQYLMSEMNSQTVAMKAKSLNRRCLEPASESAVCCR
ncbi:MAG: hypothetical protein ACLVJ6_07685 [Merdibacter sp.]